MINWAAEALSEIDRGEPVALVTVIAAEGSTPREAGARMLVGPNRLVGTIGGGNLEHQAMRQARAMLGQDARAYAVQDYPLGPLLSQCCGGHVRLLLEKLDRGSVSWLEEVRTHLEQGSAFALEARFSADRLDRRLMQIETEWPGALEPARLVGADGQPREGRRPKPSEGDALIEKVDARRPTLMLFGAGHVGQAVARVFRTLDFRIEWFDSRPEASEADATVAVHDEARLIELAAQAGPDDFVLILTHNHELDYRLTEAALKAGPRYCGLIGSKTKRARFERRLAEADVATQGLTCPIGIASLKSKAPEVIAVAVAAELLEIVERGRA
ncbi:MAG: xanthine dehydrogenase accessory protein XdhC [Proteobacteria bacterium]|nr:xanthine dehydrogenase accessory protein XdhC [Pseudomonadota bacterium]